MSYVDKYETYLNEIPADIEKCYSSGKRHVLAYTSNYDVVLKWDVDAYNKILEQYLHEEPYAKEGDSMDSMEDFARISCYYILRGLGANFNVGDVGVCDYLQSHFETESALGGTCAQGAAALGSMGFPIHVKLTDKSKEVCELLNYKGMTTIKDGKMVPIMEAATEEAPVYHMIVQFSKGDKIIVNGEEREVPLSNRLILFYDEIHKVVPIEEDFIAYWNEHADQMYSYLASGFDAVVDPEIMKERLAQLKEHFEAMRKKNPDFMFYFEGAFYMNPANKEMANDLIGQYADIMGMNEEELVAQAERFGIQVDITDLTSITKGLDYILTKYPIRGVILHTKDYSMYYGEKLNNINIEKGLTIGNIMSGTRARIGKYGTQEECKESLELPLSEQGLKFAEELDTMNLEKYACIVPSRYLEHPKYTIGLGDTFVSGVHTCFVV